MKSSERLKFSCMCRKVCCSKAEIYVPGMIPLCYQIVNEEKDYGWKLWECS